MNKFDLILVVTIAWIFFPLVALWIWLTNPGKCALIFKKELNNSWFDKDVD